MAILDNKKEQRVFIPANFEDIILQPRITEKASFRSGGNIYTFEVAATATKTEIKRAIEMIYKVSPTKVNIAQIPAKATLSRGKKGVKKGGKKAYVYLKEGDSIEIV